MHYIGLMSGTSVNSIDAVLVSFPSNGRLVLVASHAQSFPTSVRNKIQSLMYSGEDELKRMGELDITLGELFAEAVQTVLEKGGIEKSAVRAIGSHGQTLRHCPNAQPPFTLQIGNPSVIAERTGITTVADFRARDMAAGGQGAPLVPAFHQGVFHSSQYNRAIVNIGGIANISYLPAKAGQAVLGFDTGPGNTLLDQWIHRHQTKNYDESGSWAESGKVVVDLLDQLLSDPYLASPPPKSSGREHFNLVWLDNQIKKISRPPSAEGVQATLLQLTVRSIADAIRTFHPKVDEVYVCGGGAHNRALMSALTGQLKGTVIATTQSLGLHPDWVEAAAFAWLAHQTLSGLPGNVASVTGAKRPVILGGIYPA